MLTKHLCNSLEELETIAGKLLEKYPQERIFAFYGEMGVGNFTFIRQLGKQLHVRDVINSPTFAIVNEYLCINEERICHFDLYRVKSWKEIMDIGYEDYFYSGHYCLIEWPEKIEDLLPEDAIHVKIELSGKGDGRIFTF